MKFNIVLINGHPGSGKDTFCEFCSEVCSTVYNISTVDKIKEAAKLLGWDEKKDEKSRKFLSDLRKLADEYCDSTFLYVLNEIEALKSYHNTAKSLDDNPIVFIHVREPERIQKFKNHFGDECCALFIESNVKKIISNESDKNVENYDYDYRIKNKGTLEELKEKAIDFVKLITIES